MKHVSHSLEEGKNLGWNRPFHHSLSLKNMRYRIEKINKN
jgi:hypothetical protein